ncbi:endoplasmic reticulum mannosyl-oligosaccharide 1,2-alpha-mannosidase-like [Panonychus citri]|uniref:endoplasmic reticulum mannosyl-oligosaccharide 1,2-alpha-mannosidase-like n=1 Tax=Panonychus citri TaxID=50023 RepID=UPI0023073A21|nr:endoplasmic reticulum mannosyl-oligosaccharide 1,2-alpha-mannosidase-like [Panonychus citri]
MTSEREHFINDPETGSKSSLLFKSNRIRLLRLWRPLPRFVKIFLGIVLLSVSLMSCLLMVWPDLIKNNLPINQSSFKLDSNNIINELNNNKNNNEHHQQLPQPQQSVIFSPQQLPRPKQQPSSNQDTFSVTDILKPLSPNSLQSSSSSSSSILDPLLLQIKKSSLIVSPSSSSPSSSSSQYRSFVKVEGDFSLDDISWERDILNSEVAINNQQKEIIAATLHSWEGYRKYAWGQDTLKPISQSYATWFGVGLTIIDSLDTLLLMGLEKEFKESLDWIEKDLNFHSNGDVNCFEMTIRVLGGLLSSYHITRSATLLTKALDVGDRLIHCFDSKSGSIPYSDVNLLTKLPKSPVWSQDSSTSEVSTMQLEFRDLSRITKQSIFEETSFKTSLHLHELTKDDPLVPMFINPATGSFSPSTITLGARGDSYYEYLLKQYLQTGIDWLKGDWLKAVDAIRNRLVRVTQGPKQLTFIGELLRRETSVVHPKMDHLVCFLSGSLALGHHHLTKTNAYADDYAMKSKIDQHLELALALARTCQFMYNTTQTGLSPEIMYFNENPSQGEDELTIHPADAHNLLRPEHVESLFYLYHLTKDQQYRDQGWQIFQSFNKYCKIPTGGYTSIGDVRDSKHVRPKDHQESFWFAETLKYLYLLFSDDEQLIHKILNHYIFNTEGHLVKRYQYPTPQEGSS